METNKFAIILLNTRLIDFHLSQAYGHILIIDPMSGDTSGTICIIKPSLNHGSRHHALMEANNNAMDTLTNEHIPHNRIQRLIWNENTSRYDDGVL